MLLDLIILVVETILHQIAPHMDKITTTTVRMLIDLWYKIEMHTMVNSISLSG